MASPLAVSCSYPCNPAEGPDEYKVCAVTGKPFWQGERYWANNCCYCRQDFCTDRLVDASDCYDDGMAVCHTCLDVTCPAHRAKYVGHPAGGDHSKCAVCAVKPTCLWYDPAQPAHPHPQGGARPPG